MKRAIVTLALALLTSSGAAAQQVSWTLDKNHSHVGFTARHLAFAKVRGQFKKFDAHITADAKTGEITSLEATAQVSSISTDNAKRDKHLRSDDFFAAKAHPILTLKSKSIRWKGDKFTAVVALTMRGITRDVTFKGERIGVRTVNFGKGPQQRAAYEASATIKRKEFGLNFNGLAEGISIVGDEVEIELEMEASYVVSH